MFSFLLEKTFQSSNSYFIIRVEAKKLFENKFKATKDFGVRLDAFEFKSVSGRQPESLSRVFGGRSKGRSVAM